MNQLLFAFSGLCKVIEHWQATKDAPRTNGDLCKDLEAVLCQNLQGTFSSISKPTFFSVCNARRATLGEPKKSLPSRTSTCAAKLGHTRVVGCLSVNYPEKFVKNVLLCSPYEIEFIPVHSEDNTRASIAVLCVVVEPADGRYRGQHLAHLWVHVTEIDAGGL